nr:unnamed protein product [Callosobruchus analis]
MLDPYFPIGIHSHNFI